MNKAFFTTNRQRLYSLLPPGAIIIVYANDIMPTNGDGTYRYTPNNDLYYLTGIVQDETVFVAFPDYYKNEWQELLFIKKREPEKEKWTGKFLDKEEVSAISGINNVLEISILNETLKQMMYEAQYVYFNINEHPREYTGVPTLDYRKLKSVMDAYPSHEYNRISTLLHSLRSIKQPNELECLSKAAELSGKAFMRLCRFIKPGKYEYEAEAEFGHEIKMAGGDWAGYTPIMASGADTCILHYTANNKECRNGDLLLIDAAASWGYYHADMSRTIPVNGKFSERQRQLYKAVLACHRYARTLLVKDALIQNVFKELRLFTFEQLLELGLVKSGVSYTEQEKHQLVWKYSYHNASHFLGLDVHDVGFYSQRLKENMVLTNEPGIYIEAEGIGVRLENNIVIMDEGNADLMGNIPIEIDEIENIMNT